MVAGAAAAFLLIAIVSARLSGARLVAEDVQLVAGATLALAIMAAALVVLDALQTGFGALDAFFREALERAERRAREDLRAAAMRARDAAAAPDPAAPAERGVIADRPYVLHGDGAVTIETLFGVRRFASMREAREFIGA